MKIYPQTTNSAVIRTLLLSMLKGWVETAFAEIEADPATFLAKLVNGPRDPLYLALYEELWKRVNWDQNEVLDPRNMD